MIYPIIKRGMDFLIALLALIILCPLFLFLLIAIKMESAGTVFFKQKRVGVHKKHFMIYKFRTMRTDTPKDMPTHLLQNPDQYITKIGGFLRKTSLDELPQLFNILKGEMALVGPRPALWNQEDLIAERDKYGANDIRPGLTGWAQVNGRDELEIPVKAALDGEYVKRMRFLFDVKCLFRTFVSVVKSDGVVEGGTGSIVKQKTVVLIGNHFLTIYNFRKELIERLVKCGYKVVVFMPVTEETKKIETLGCEIVDVPVDRHGMNPIRDGKLLSRYKKLLRAYKPSMVFTYTIKPNIYGGMACKSLHIPYVCTITGLGKGIENGGPVRTLVLTLYKIALRKVQTVYFQNESNQKIFADKKIGGGRYRIVNGSGVNLEAFPLKPFPTEEEPVRFIYVARISKIKGIDVLLEAIDFIKKKYPQVEFHLLGFWEEDYKDKILQLQEQGQIIYHGMQADVAGFMEKCHCLVHPSRSEGMSNVCLEASATGRAVIASDIPGCRECITDGETGYLHRMDDREDLIEKIEKFISLSYNDKKCMGELGRKKVEAEFSREKIVDAYMEEFEKQSGKGMV